MTVVRRKMSDRTHEAGVCNNSGKTRKGSPHEAVALYDGCNAKRRRPRGLGVLNYIGKTRKGRPHEVGVLNDTGEAKTVLLSTQFRQMPSEHRIVINARLFEHARPYGHILTSECIKYNKAMRYKLLSRADSKAFA